MAAKPDIRRLSPGDSAALTRFLAAHADSSLFLRSNLQAAGLTYDGRPFEGVYVGMFAGEALLGVAAHYWNGVIVLQAPHDAGALARAAVETSARAVQGLVGPWAQTSAARTALGAERRPTSLNSKEILSRLALSELRVPASLTNGVYRCRRSHPSDIGQLIEWRMGYSAEALHEPDTPANRAKQTPALERAHAAGEIFVLEHADRAVSTCHFNATAGDMVQIGGVWTPPALRRRGYARAVVAGAVLAARTAGVLAAVLFTNEDNLAAQRAYAAIGFTPIGDYGLIMFDGD